MHKTILVILLMAACIANAQQYPPVTIPGSEVRTITSSVIAGQEYELHILLPGGHAQSSKKYPVVYVMDSQWDFPLVKSIYGQQYFDGFIPELIIVGVTWGGTKPNPDSLRARDYTPTKEPGLKQSGGADNFLAFMKNELFPFMEKNYKANDDRTLMGCSLGGLLTLYTLFTHTDMFTGYVAASPAMQWDKGVLYQYESKFAQIQRTKAVKVYMTIGDVEMSKPAYEKFAGTMLGRKYAAVAVRSKILENTGHSGTKSETYTRGLQYVFERKDLTLTDAALKKYVGTYEYSDGNKVEIKNVGNQLYCYLSPGTSLRLYANSDTHFYATQLFLNMYFKMANGNVEGFELALFNNTQTWKKVN
jgi:predicted alpha/beta superfamily hydrolase